MVHYLTGCYFLYAFTSAKYIMQPKITRQKLQKLSQIPGNVYRKYIGGSKTLIHLDMYRLQSSGVASLILQFRQGKTNTLKCVVSTYMFK